MYQTESCGQNWYFVSSRSFLRFLEEKGWGRGRREDGYVLSCIGRISEQYIRESTVLQWLTRVSLGLEVTRLLCQCVIHYLIITKCGKSKIRATSDCRFGVCHPAFRKKSDLWQVYQLQLVIFPRFRSEPELEQVEFLAILFLPEPSSGAPLVFICLIFQNLLKR